MPMRFLSEQWGRQVMAISLALLTMLACSPSEKEPLVALSNPLFVEPATRDFSQNPELLERIVENPHGYLRFINIQFTQEVCRRFEDSLPQYPPFNLHGDAHLEQYAVTDLGRGLTDFDDSSTGPAVVDLMRFGVSLRLATAAHGWDERADEVLDAFLSGYRTALVDPLAKAPEPTVVTRLQGEFEYDREEYFEWVEEISDPVPEEEQTELLAAMQHYFENMRAESPGLAADYLTVQRVGYLRLGIGSALDLKYLVQIRGESDALNDDVVLELKQVRDLGSIECVSAGRGSACWATSIFTTSPSGLMPGSTTTERWTSVRRSRRPRSSWRWPTMSGCSWGRGIPISTTRRWPCNFAASRCASWIVTKLASRKPPWRWHSRWSRPGGSSLHAPVSPLHVIRPGESLPLPVRGRSIVEGGGPPARRFSVA